nr:MAG TPA: HicB-like toxin [Caudoviricetes sp.]
MKYLYTAIFTRKESGKGYYASVPDLPGCISTGRDLDDAIDQIADAAACWLVAAEDEGLPISSPTPQSELPVPDAAVCSLIRVDSLAYRAITDTKAVRKNVSLPAWMATMADKRGINCSQVLQDSLMQRFDAR